VAKLNQITGRFENTGGDEYWEKAGIPTDRAGRQMSNFFDMSEFEKNRAEAKRMKEEMRSKRMNWKKINAIKKEKKRKQRNQWLLED